MESSKNGQKTEKKPAADNKKEEAKAAKSSEAPKADNSKDEDVLKILKEYTPNQSKKKQETGRRI